MSTSTLRLLWAGERRPWCSGCQEGHTDPHEPGDDLAAVIHTGAVDVGPRWTVRLSEVEVVGDQGCSPGLEIDVTDDLDVEQARDLVAALLRGAERVEEALASRR